MPYRDNTSGLHVIELELTKRCNLACKHCYVDRSQSVDLASDRALALIEEGNQLGVNRLVLTGGEPLLYPDTFLLGRHAKDLGIPEVALMTNGLLITEHNVDQLNAFDIVQMSLELPGPSTVRMRSNYHKILTRKIRMLQACGITPYLYATLYKESLPFLEEMVSFAQSMGVHLGFNKLVPVGADPILLSQQLSHKEYKEALRTLAGFMSRGFDINCHDPLLFLVDEKRMHRLRAEDPGRICGGCIAGIAAVYIAATGEAYPCPFVCAACGNVYDSSLEEIWEGSGVLQRFRMRSQFSGPCGTCAHRNYCGGCRGASYAAHRTYFGSDPNCFLLTP